MKVINEINKGFLISFVIICFVSSLTYITYGHLKAGYIVTLPPKVVTIAQYIFAGISILQLMAVFNVIYKGIFDDKAIDHISKILEESNDKLLKRFPSSDATIVKGCKLTYDINFTFVLYGLSMAFVGADKVTFASFLFLAMISTFITWLWTKSKATKYYQCKSS
ncbi:MAG: hypothetical protein AB1782_06465 [Cyanobacteriota bacterium]